MLVIGLDAAAQWKKFGYAIGSYKAHVITIESAGLLGDETGLVSKIGPYLQVSKSALIAIDAPLGWPKTLGSALANHYAGNALMSSPNHLFRRVTDNHIHTQVGKRPLDIGANKIARAAWRALDVLCHLRRIARRDIPVLVEPWDHSGLAAIEVYPAATLTAHGIRASNYKDNEGAGTRRSMAQKLESLVSGITAYAKEVDDIFDACVCLVAALDFFENKAMPATDIASARKEGWIWVRYKD